MPWFAATVFPKASICRVDVLGVVAELNNVAGYQISQSHLGTPDIVGIRIDPVGTHNIVRGTGVGISKRVFGQCPALSVSLPVAYPPCGPPRDYLIDCHDLVCSIGFSAFH